MLLDPAIQLLPHVGFDFAERERADRAYDSPEEPIEERLDSRLRRLRASIVEEEIREHLVQHADGKLPLPLLPGARSSRCTRELCDAAAAARDAAACRRCSSTPAEFGLVRDDQVEAYERALGDRLEVVDVPGGHIVYWDAFDETADAVERFLRLEDPRAERDATSSTASSPVSFSRSRIGLTSTTSSESQQPGLGDELHREVRLAIREPAAHGRADARRDVRVEHVHVEADVDEAGARDVRERLANGTLDSEPVDVAHREDARVELRQELPLAVVERADADQRHAARATAGSDQPSLGNRAPAEPERGREHHPVDVAARARLRAVEVAVRVDPEHAALAVHPREAAERPERDRVVAAQDERDRALRATASATRSAMRWQVSLICGRNRACSSPTGDRLRRRRRSTLPRSMQSWPSSASRASRPA